MDNAGIILTYGGIAFLVLGLLVAAKEVFLTPAPSTRPGPGSAEGVINDANNLVQTIAKLKTWLALAVIGLLMIGLGAAISGTLTPWLSGGAPTAQEPQTKTGQ